MARTKNSPTQPSHEPWTADDYAAAGITDSGAAKLADSAVAPLVAAARGYLSVDESTTSAARKRLGLPSASPGQGRDLDAMLDAGGDVLLMPWFTPEALVAGQWNPVESDRVVQYRPSDPWTPAKAKRPAKYLFPKATNNASPPIGVHPSYPAGWLNGAPQVLIAEGLLKGDSAMSAWLAENGVSRDELAYCDPSDAHERLRAVLEGIGQAGALVVITFTAVGTWSNNGSWTAISMRGRQTFVGLDADLSENADVYREATKLDAFLARWKAGSVSWLRPSLPGDPKAGVDDFLAVTGSFASLLATAEDELPDAPADAKAELGSWRIGADGVSLEQLTESDNGSGHATRRWHKKAGFGGRVIAFTQTRFPSELEMATGRIAEGNEHGQAAEDSVVVDVAYRDTNGVICHTQVNGPVSLLSEPPERWHSSRMEAIIPTDLHGAVGWPPAGEVGRGFRDAVRAHRREEAEESVVWQRMGWVPTVGDEAPVFIFPDETIGPDEAPVTSPCAVTNSVMQGASKFGVGAPDYRDFTDPAYQADAREDLKKTIVELVKGGAWNDGRHGWLTLAAALRPAVPVEGGVAMCFTGPAGTGKSFTAGIVMGFWSARPGLFDEKNLPGHAIDTAATTEMALARTPLWVIDDVKPSTDPRKAAAELDVIDKAIRGVHDRSNRRRSNADTMGERASWPVGANLLIVTAENEIPVPSARSRAIGIPVARGYLSTDYAPTDALKALCSKDGAPARVTRALIKFIHHMAVEDGWAAVVDDLASVRESAGDHLARLITRQGSSATRTAGVVVPLSITLRVLDMLVTELGLREELAELGIEVWNEANPDSGGNQLVSIAKDMIDDTLESSTGRLALAAIRGCLLRGDGYVSMEGAPNGSGAPYSGTGDKALDARLAEMLGWAPDAAGAQQRRGKALLGHLVFKGETPYVFLHTEAINVARRQAGENMLHGQTSTSIVSALRSDNLLSESEFSRRVVRGKPSDRSRVGNIDGFPVELSTLLGPSWASLGRPDEGDDFEMDADVLVLPQTAS